MGVPPAPGQSAAHLEENSSLDVVSCTAQDGVRTVSEAQTSLQKTLRISQKLVWAEASTQ